MVKAQLKYSIDRSDTEFYLITAGALELFPSSGEAYVGDEKFTYTGKDSEKLTGCSGILYSHEVGEMVSTARGVTYSQVLPPTLRKVANDPAGVVEAITRIVDETQLKYIKDKLLSVHNVINPVVAPEALLEHICTSLGVEFGVDQGEEIKRSLAKNAAALLRGRGSLNAFKFIVWHVLGYDVSVDIAINKPVAVHNNSNSVMYQPPYEMGIDNRVTNYWRLESTSTTTAPNSIGNGEDLSVASSLMWNTSSMFTKDSSLTFDSSYSWASANGGSSTSLFFTNKERITFEWFMEPDSSSTFPQTIFSKGSWLAVTRTNADSLRIDVTDGIHSDTVTVTGVITSEQNQLVTLIFDSDTLIVQIDGRVVFTGIFFPYPFVDDGELFWLGNISASSAFKGKLDTFRISVGKKHTVEALQYFRHIDILRSHFTDNKRNRYMLQDYTSPYYVTITINNDDGDRNKYYTLQYLIEEWLTPSNYNIIRTSNMPLEMLLGLI